MSRSHTSVVLGYEVDGADHIIRCLIRNSTMSGVDLVNYQIPLSYTKMNISGNSCRITASEENHSTGMEGSTRKVQLRQQLTPLQSVLGHKGVKMYVKDGYVKIPSIIRSRTGIRRYFKVLIWVRNSAGKKHMLALR